MQKKSLWYVNETTACFFCFCLFFGRDFYHEHHNANHKLTICISFFSVLWKQITISDFCYVFRRKVCPPLSVSLKRHLECFLNFWCFLRFFKQPSIFAIILMFIISLIYQWLYLIPFSFSGNNKMVPFVFTDFSGMNV